MENLNPIELELQSLDREAMAALEDPNLPSQEWYRQHRQAIVRKSLVKKADRPAVKYAYKQW